MNKKKHALIVAGCCFSLCLCNVRPANSRVTILSGELGLQQEYNSNIFQTEDAEGQWTTILLPTLTLSSEGDKDLLSVSGGSILEWDQRRDVREFEHNLSFSATREIFQRFQVTLSDGYSYFDNSARADMDPLHVSLTDRFARAGHFSQSEVARLLFPEISYTPDDYLQVLTQLQQRYDAADQATRDEVDRYLTNSPDNGRRRYWENEIVIEGTFEFARDSVLSFGYGYSMNDDRSADITEYYEHSPRIGLTYRFNPQWLAGVNYELTKGQYDQSDDVRNHETTFIVEYGISHRDTLSLNYDYGCISYQGEREDSIEQSGEFGWAHDFTPHTRLSATFTGNYLGREYSYDERGGEVGLGLNHLLPRGTVSFGFDGLFDEGERGDNSGWDHLRSSWSVNGGMTYDLLQDLSTSVAVSYEKRYEWLETTVGKSIFNDYSADVSMTYTFGQWFTVRCGYTFNMLDVQNSAVSGYKEHVLMLEFAAVNDLMRW